jgi:tRNA modification GTPase
MFDPSDTIVAIATPPGRGGIGIVRLSGPDAVRVAGVLTSCAAAFEPRHATLARVAGRGGAIDRVLVTSFPCPHSYTGEDVVEISAHGSPVLLQQIVDSAMSAGARAAAPGEFTLRAFLHGRMDLVQAEAVRDLIDAVTPVQARAAFDQLEGTLTGRIRSIEESLFDLTARLEASLDFPAEGYHFIDHETAGDELATICCAIGTLLDDAHRGTLIRDGLHAVIAGRPNTGKSSLFNRLAGAERAIVTDVPGTTRDLVTEVVDIGGVAVTLVDTAGVRELPGDAIEAEGIARAEGARQVAAVTLVVLDASQPLTADDRRVLDQTSPSPRVVIANKSDLPRAWTNDVLGLAVVELSAITGDGVDMLRSEMLAVMHASAIERDVPAITNRRHAALLTDAHAALVRAREAARGALPEEFLLADIHDARALLEEVTGRRAPDAVVHAIFDRFCIGK